MKVLLENHKDMFDFLVIEKSRETCWYSNWGYKELDVDNPCFCRRLFCITNPLRTFKEEISIGMMSVHEFDTLEEVIEFLKDQQFLYELRK